MMVERCDFYSDEEYEGALQDKAEADREQLAKEEESFTDHLINLGYRRGYAKAIEEFAEKLCDAFSENPLTVILENRVKADMLTVDGACEIVYEIAKKLKGE